MECRPKSRRQYGGDSPYAGARVAFRMETAEAEQKSGALPRENKFVLEMAGVLGIRPLVQSGRS